MYALTTSGGSHVAAGGSRTQIRIPDLRGPLVATLVVALVTSVSALIPSATTTTESEVADVAKAAAAAATAAESQLVQAGEVPDGLTAGEWADVQRQIAAAEAVEAVPANVSRSAATITGSPSVGGFAAPKIVSSGTVAHFEAAGAAVTVADSGTSVIFRTSNVGDIELGSTAPAMANGQAQYLHTPVVTETYRDTAEGLHAISSFSLIIKSSS